MNMDRVFLRDLKIRCIIGILPQERVKAQDLLVNCSLECDLRECAALGSLKDSIDYFALAQFVKDYTQQRRAELLETLGEELCTEILKRFKAQSVTLRLEKPQAVPGAAGAGIELERTR
ncbi:MAG: dihydroneopterin aldolase [Succinivibrio sp.]|jgi:dihydroneopterin aldolase|nr:dihydroneopterin aldolase [Succinivibrio sp.]